MACYVSKPGRDVTVSIQIQCCGIAILLILFFFLDRQRRTDLLTERVFRWVMLVCFICLLLDVGSVLAINAAQTMGQTLPHPSVDLICKFYLLTIPAVGVVTLFYICADIDYKNHRHLRRDVTLYAAMGALGWIAILALPIQYHRNDLGQVEYTTGPSVYATYVCIVIYLGCIAYRLIRDRDKMNHRRRVGVLAWMVLWTGSFLAQLIYGKLLLAGFACAMGVLIIYLSLENPEGNLDRQTGLFRRDVLRATLKQRYGEGKDFSVLVLLFARGQENAEDARLDLMLYLESHKEWMAFREDGERLYLLFDTPQEAQAAMDKIDAYLAQRGRTDYAMPLKIHWLFMPSAKVVDGRQEDLLSLIRDIAIKHFPEVDRLVVDAQLIDNIRQDRRIEKLLANAIAEDRIEVFYQPIYSIAQRRITGAEALARIRDEDGRLVSPALFIPIAESNGMILRLGRIIFDHVCRFIKDHPLEGLGLTNIDVNLSVIQCGYADLAMDYMDIMRRYGIDPRQINLEITESASIHEKKLLLTNMDKLIDYGVSFALDDFGTGQSNLTYIMDMPVAVAKFDRSITQAYFVNEKARQVMSAAVRMIHGMGLTIVSEGVETAEEGRAIRDLGIEYIQGFYFSRPLPEEEFLEYLRSFQPPALSVI